MAKQQNGNSGSGKNVPQKWEEVDLKYRAAVEERILLFNQNRNSQTAGLLDLSGIGLDDQLFQIFAREWLPQLSGITSLDLGGNYIGPGGAQALAKQAKHMSALNSLNLNGNSIGEDGARALAEQVKHLTALAVLKLYDNSIGEIGAQALADQAKHLSALNSLDLSGNSIGEIGARVLAEQANHLTALTVLNLYDNSIGEIGARALAEQAKHLASLASLDLSGNEIGDDAACALAQQAMYMTSLASLDLGISSIGPEGARALAAQSKYLTALSSLSLYYNSIGPEGARALAAQSKYLTALTSLSLGDNSIGDADSIVQLIDALSGLQTLQITGNNLRWPHGDNISDSFLQDTNPQILKNKLIDLRDKGVVVRHARITTAGISGAGKTHYSRRLEWPDDPELKQEIDHTKDNRGRITKGIRPISPDKEITFKPEDYQIKIPELRLIVQDVGGHRQQHKAHHHLIYLAGESIYVLCVSLTEPVDGWQRYYVELLQDLCLRRYCATNPERWKSVNKDNFPDEKKFRVVVVPTKRDLVKEKSVIQERLKQLTKILQGQWALRCEICEPISNLDAKDHRKVNKLVAKQLGDVPGLAQRTKSFVPKLVKKVREHFALMRSDGKRAKHISMHIREIDKLAKKIDGYEKDDLRSAVLELLRLGVVIAPLSEAPDQQSKVPITKEIEWLMNPKFVNDQLYDLLMDSELAAVDGGFIGKDKLKKHLKLSKLEYQQVENLLEDHLVAFPYEYRKQVEGLLIPDRFPERDPGVFPEPQIKSIKKLIEKSGGK